MKIFKVKSGLILKRDTDIRLVRDANWDTFINDDSLHKKCLGDIGEIITPEQVIGYLDNELLPPIQSQEVWASGVTYFNSKIGREQESKDAGGGSFYAHVYTAERPEIFFKATPHRVVGHKGMVRIRKDSTWDVPEPELTLVVSSSGKIIGYTIGNDMSSRSIEGENPLYLPQAKSYDGSTALGPCILVTDKPLPKSTKIHLLISRAGKAVFGGEIGIDQIKREFDELVSFLYREASFPYGSFLMTGTGIVPGSDFTLKSGDVVTISIDGIGTLENTVA
ncbi:MAG: fumarylacetoacetate hydrolase family protein [Cyclobacteriaceae bacterium]|nr:fumarylacetoacetate hydrolase family protein [Cyclobacteriaceae bacterium]